MTKFALMRILCSVAFFLTGIYSFAQECDDPHLICGTGEVEETSTENGEITTLPPEFCFDLAENAVFLSFETLDLDQFPNLAFNGSAILSIAGLNCNADTLYGQGALMAVFTANDLCDPHSFNDPIACDTIYQSTEFELENLESSTTYYILLSGFTGDLPAIYPGECEAVISITGPAVSYDLETSWEPNTNGVLLTGQTLTLHANPNLTGYTWSGSNLNATTGNTVTANPMEEEKNLKYTVEAEINGCTFLDVITVPVLPAIMPYNTFTPNGDGINDTWKIDRITQWPNAQIYVYSRWGTKVFQTINYQNDWDGDDLPAATYYYVIELNPLDMNLEPFTGSVTIIR